MIYVSDNGDCYRNADGAGYQNFSEALAELEQEEAEYILRLFEAKTKEHKNGTRNV